jgi:putative ABC transport system permease protein
VSVVTKPEPPPAAPHDTTHLGHLLHIRRGMGVAEAFRVAFEGLMANKMRSFLTMLGIIIGVSAVIVMVSLGQGVAKATKESIARLGTNMINVRPNSQSVRGVSMGVGSLQTLKLEDAETVLKACPAVKAVSPVVRSNGQVKYRNANTVAGIYGTGPDYFQIRNLPIAKGHGFTDDDVRRKAKVAVIGHNIAETLFSRSDPINKYMKINGQNFKVVGVVQKRGDSGFRSPDDEVTIPVTTAMQRVFGQDYLDSLTIQAVSEERMLEAQDQILAALRKAHRLRPDEESDVRVMNQADITESANQQTTFLTMLLAGIAFVSLIVGGIGIMNIMLVSVTERTREIGIRKAIGAKRRDIRYQFLIESITLSLVGGLIGIGLGVGVSLWMALPADRGGLGFPMLLSTPPIVVAFAFSALVGTFFGMYPAVKASALDPIEALRYE